MIGLGILARSHLYFSFFFVDVLWNGEEAVRCLDNFEAENG
jgi:hypothetical protein